jgi:hypothetical protein
MSAASSAAVGFDRKSASASAVQRWTERLTPALNESLLPELIHLAAQYMSDGFRFDKRLTSPNVKIDDADEDGFGRTLSTRHLSDWSLAFCEEPLSALADAQGRAPCSGLSGT